MPPPKRTRGPQGQPKKRNMMSVYPPTWVGPVLGGYKSAPFTRAIACWARTMLEATSRMEAEFSAKEWSALWAATRERGFDPEDPEPGRLLAQALSRHQATKGGLGKILGGDGRVQPLADRLLALTYVEAWAVLVPIFFREENPPGPEDDAREWWTIAWRQQKLAPREE